MVLDRTSEDIAKGQPGQIKVMDFGISRAIEEALFTMRDKPADLIKPVVVID